MLIAFGLFSCKKEETQPDTTSLIGRWAAEDISWQFDIKNLKGEGEPVSYTEENSTQGHFLRMSHKSGNESHVYTFKILALSNKEFKAITPANDTLRFTKF